MILKPKTRVWKYVLLTTVMVIAIVAVILYWTIAHNNGYKPFPKEYSAKQLLMKYLKPNRHYEYWGYFECKAGFNLNKKSFVLYNYGSIPGALKIKDPGGSLFVSCLPGICYNYIAYADNNKMKYITSNKELIEFIGQVDNLQEAILVAYAKGYYINSSFGMGYREVVGGYEMVVKREVMCPRTVETFLLKFNRKGIDKVEKRNVDNIGGCIVQ